LWSGLSLRHLRRRTYSLYGTLRRQTFQACLLTRSYLPGPGCRALGTTGFHGIAISIHC